MKKIYVPNQNMNSGWLQEDFIIVNSIEDADILLLIGERNVSSEIGGHEDIPNLKTKYRDDVNDMGDFYRALDCDNIKLIVGINSGANALCLLNGGKLIQSVDNHELYGLHLITNGREERLITSNHKQLQYPYDLPRENYEILYWAYPNRGTKYEGNDMPKASSADFVEPEIVLYKGDNKKCLAIQGSPYKMKKFTSTFKLVIDLINKYAE